MWSCPPPLDADAENLKREVFSLVSITATHIFSIIFKTEIYQFQFGNVLSGSDYFFICRVLLVLWDGRVHKGLLVFQALRGLVEKRAKEEMRARQELLDRKETL